MPADTDPGDLGDGKEDHEVTLYSSDDRPLRAPAQRPQELAGRAANGRRAAAVPATPEPELEVAQAGGEEEKAAPQLPAAPAPAPEPPAAAQLAAEPPAEPAVDDDGIVDAFAAARTASPAPSPAPPRAEPTPPHAAIDFASQSFLVAAAMPPAAGWRRVVWQATGHRYIPPLSRSEQRRQEVTLRARASVSTPTVIASAAGKGGVGKTTVALGTAVAAALVRADRLAVIDANPDAGSLAGRVASQPPPATIAELLEHAASITRAAEVWRYLIQHPSRLDVLAAPLDPAVTRQLGEAEYSRALEILTRFYSIIYADLGTALLGPATSYFLRRRADQVILVSAPSLDAGRIAGFTLDHLVVARGADWCRRHVIVVVNAVRNDTLVDVRKLEQFFAPHVRATHRVAWDRHLAAGGALQWDLLEHRTRDCYLELAALIADGFTEGEQTTSPSARPRRERQGARR